MKNFAEAMKYESTKTFTENGAFAYNSTMNDLVDLFACIGALRSRDEKDIEAKFARAFANDKLLATKMLFYCGDIRNGGLGERRTFRVCLKWLANNHPEIVKKNIHNIPYYNRFDSLFVLIGTPCEKEMWKFVSKILTSDISEVVKAKKENRKPNISLLGKWMPSENASSKETKKLARKAMCALGLTPRIYRLTLSILRKNLDVTEVKMSAKEWNKIHYEFVPSYAMRKYSNAFLKHDKTRFEQYMKDLNDKTKNVKINSSTLYPYDLIHDIMKGKNLTVEEQWNSLPNYVEGKNDILVMADVSGSMYGRPLETSIGLAIYFAERNQGQFHNLYMSFSSDPNFIAIHDTDSLNKKVEQLVHTQIGFSTNLEKAFLRILGIAVKYHMKDEDLPKALCVISDMEIDRYIEMNGLDFVNTMRERFKSYGFTLPKLILWNVEARNDTFLTQSKDVIKVSGQSASVFKRLCGNLNGKTDYEFMIETLNNKAYDAVVI